MKKIVLILSICVILPILGISNFLIWEEWDSYKSYGHSISIKVEKFKGRELTQLISSDLFGEDWQTACLMVGFPYQYRDQEYKWLSNMLGEKIDFEDLPISFADDTGIQMVVFLKTSKGLVKEAGFNAKNWSMFKSGTIECTKSKSSKVTYKKGVLSPEFEYKFNVYTDEMTQF